MASRWRVMLGMLALVMSSRPSAAQSTAQVPLEFDFLNPGARSVALGGAFAAVADDATAAFTNPAGLTQLGAPEISFEPRLLVTDSRYFAGGRISGVPTQQGPDTVSGPVYGTDTDTRVVPSFLSGVFPTRRWAVAAYYQQQSRTNNTLLNQGAFERLTFAGETTDAARDDALEGTRRISVASVGTSVGVQVTPSFALGAGAVFQRLTLDSSFTRYGYTTTLFGPFDRNRVSAQQTQSGRDYGVGWQFGGSKNFGPTLRVGAVVRLGAALTFEQVDTSAQIGRVDRFGKFRVPDVISIGSLWRPRDSVAIVGEVSRVGYNRLKQDYVSFQTLAAGSDAQVKLDDAYEVHGGFEWTLVRSDPHVSPVFRFGTWYDPGHAVRYEETSDAPGELRLAAALPGTTGRFHYSGGIGWPQSSRFEINGAADVSSRSLTLSASIIVRFIRRPPSTPTP